MRDSALSSFIQIGVDILNAVRDAVTNTVTAQTGDVVAQQVDAQRSEWWQHVGYVSIPSNPVPGQAACQGVVARRGDIDAIIATRDLRGQDLAGNLVAGETSVYAGGADGTGQARIVLKANGAIAAITTDTNKKAGNTVYWRVTPTEERFFSPFGTRWQDATGFHIRTTSGAKFDLGGIGLPAPFAALGSFASLNAETIILDAAALVLGRDTGNMQPVTLATALLAFIAIQAEALQALQTAIAATNLAASTATGYVAGTAATSLAASAAAVSAASAPPLAIAGKTSVA